jgi:hypothetical protein
MGLSLQFALGKSDEIIQAVANEDFDFINLLDEEGNIADFSLHLSPKDFDLLLNSASSLLGIDQIIELRSNLDFHTHYFDTIDRGASLINETIPQLFSQFDLIDAKKVTEIWYSKLQFTYPTEDIEMSSYAIEAVKKLILISKRCLLEEKQLVYLWFL